jgi:diadenosine tetraphosphate (Ap4A) HIT family hydrolase
MKEGVSEFEPGCALCERFANVGPELLWSDEHWVVADILGAPGWTSVATRRHVKGSWNLSDAECAGHGPLLRDLTAAIKTATGAERVHLVSQGEMEIHFHWLIMPRLPGESPAVDGKQFIARATQLKDPAKAAEVDERIRQLMTRAAP